MACLHQAGGANRPNADDVVGVARVKRRTVRRPLEGRAVRLLGLLANRRKLRAELVNDGLGFEIPDLDARLSRRAQPIAVRREAQAVDDVTSIEGVETLAFTKVPEHRNAVLPTGGAQGTVRRDGDGVDVASVANEVRANLAVSEVPDLHELVPATRHDDRVGGHRGEANTGHPFRVRVGVLDRVLALAERVPQLNRLVPGAGDDLTVVNGEGHGKDVLGVANEASGRGTSVEVPQTERAVPGAREGELAVAGDHNLLHVVRVAVKGSARVAVVFFLTGEVPQDHRLIPGGGQQNVRVVQRGRDGRDPVFVPEKRAKNNHSKSSCSRSSRAVSSGYERR